ncbi:recombinase family protein [Acidocella sp. KAb 2-4]|uniref:recombinase family protein n=1 Tax=Acidocella sp. KAb 2-4 TaxID=2885158 RepID=UPI001D066C14|nr:recombinase family protein [Acidocella sp. KAb 2-4]MCB5945839.1 recombinase family protein [Acidocella sp. KAb 2-4]
MADGKFISYLRVSTAKQGQSGLGLEAQRAAIAGYLNGGQWALLQEFVEVESGKDNDRPQLVAAFEACRLTGAKLLIAKLDRLSRDAHFLLGLDKAGVEFVAVDMPNANRLTVHLMAVIAQGEREMISARTKAALAAAKERGTVLGGFRGGPKVDHRQGTAALVKRADDFAARVGPMIAGMKAEGLSLGEIAARLNERQIRTARGGAWVAMTVKRALDRHAKG